jgi:beta-N-acetylhexosaminidase
MSFLLFDLDGTTLSSEDKELIQHSNTAGIVLFARNFHSFDQLAGLISDIRNHCQEKSFLITVDHEGGRVQRFHEAFTTLPAVGTLADIATDYDQLFHLCHEFGWLMASEVRAAGIDISFAPVADVDIGISTVIGKRSFGSEPGLVTGAVSAYIDGMREAGMAATIKHFPGHGGVRADSHLSSPIDLRNLEQLQGSELGVFETLIHKGVAAVMPAHVVYQAIDSNPASFSRYWLIHYLRNKLAFEGCIFSDDLTMQAARAMGSATDRAKLALNAGCDVILCCNDRASVIEILDNVSWSASNRWQALCAPAPLLADREQLNKIQSSHRYQALINYC